jgi:hypothetical protein
VAPDTLAPTTADLSGSCGGTALMAAETQKKKLFETKKR